MNDGAGFRGGSTVVSTGPPTRADPSRDFATQAVPR